jgi:hypothetical protein
MLRRSTLAVAAGVAAIAGLAAPAGFASAAAAPVHTLISFSPASQEVTYATRQITIQGTLDSDSGGVVQGLPDEPVSLTLDVANYTVSLPLASVTTNSSGQFSLDTTVPVPGTVVAKFAGNTTYAATQRLSYVYRDPKTLAATDFPAKVVLAPVSPAPAYSTVTTTGQVLMKLPDGTWTPSPYAPLGVIGSGDTTPRYAADSDGDFAVHFNVIPGLVQQVEAFGGGGGWSGSATSSPLTIPLSVYPTDIADPFAPQWSSVADMTFSATTQYQNSAGQWLGLAGVKVGLFYQALGSTRWIPKGAGTSSAGGALTISHVSGFLPDGEVASAAGVWQLRIAASPRYLASVSSLVVVDVTVPVWLNGVVITHSEHRSYLTGVLDDRHLSGPVAGQEVRLYFHGRRVATARTNASGKFSFLMTGRPYGSYEIR